MVWNCGFPVKHLLSPMFSVLFQKHGRGKGGGGRGQGGGGRGENFSNFSQCGRDVVIIKCYWRWKSLKKNKKNWPSQSQSLTAKKSSFNPLVALQNLDPAANRKTLYMTSNKTMLVDEKDENLCFSQMLLKMLI